MVVRCHRLQAVLALLACVVSAVVVAAQHASPTAPVNLKLEYLDRCGNKTNRKIIQNIRRVQWLITKFTFGTAVPATLFTIFALFIINVMFVLYAVLLLVLMCSNLVSPIRSCMSNAAYYNPTIRYMTT